jgi:hypothetical protein
LDAQIENIAGEKEKMIENNDGQGKSSDKGYWEVYERFHEQSTGFKIFNCCQDLRDQASLKLGLNLRKEIALELILNLTSSSLRVQKAKSFALECRKSAKNLKGALTNTNPIKTRKSHNDCLSNILNMFEANTTKIGFVKMLFTLIEQ